MYKLESFQFQTVSVVTIPAFDR